MIESCSSCRKRRKCTKPCRKLYKKLGLPKDIDKGLRSKYRKEIPVSQTKTAAKIKSENGTKSVTIDDLKQTDSADIISDNLDKMFKSDSQEDEPGDSKKLKKINECIKSVIRDIKLIKRYRSYLRCAKMTAIARRAGVTKQTIHKQFTGITKKISTMYEKRYNEEVSDNPFKLKKAGGACRMEFKK